MRPRLFLALPLAAALVTLPLRGGEEVKKPIKESTIPLAADDKKADDKKDDKADLYAQLAAAPAGVVRKEKDKQGHVIAVLVVGRSRISTALGKAKGLEIAQERAVNNAKGKFVQWLNDSVTVVQEQSDETVILLEGAEEEGKDDAKRESGKAIEKNTTQFKSVAASLVRGLQVVYYDQQGEDKNYVVVMKWSAKGAAEARRIHQELNAPPGEKPAEKSGDKSAAPKKKKEDKTIPNKKGTIPDDD